MVDNDLKTKMNLSVDYGALVLRESQHDYAVIPGSPAASAGIKEMDVILELNNQRLDQNRPIQDFLENCNVGEEVHLLLLREGKQFPVKMVLTERKSVA